MADPFQPKFVDLVRNTTSTQGTGYFVLGAAVTGFTSFTAALQPGDTFYYSAIGVDKPAEREVGRGTLQANGSISRSPISGSLTNFSNGTKTIALIAASEWYGAAQQLMTTASRFPAVMADRASLASYSTTTTAYLREAGREGMFVWDGSDRSANVAADTRQGLYVAAASDPTGRSGAWMRKFASAVSVKWFGAVGDGSANDAPAFTSALAALKAFADNSAGGFYKGSPKLVVPAGHYFLGTTPIDVSHTVVIEGEGSGQFGPGAGGCSHLRWADGASGLRVQFPQTSGDTLVDGPTHDGAGGVVLRDLCLEGGFDGTSEGDYHGLVVRNAVKAVNLYIKNWPGEGVKAWAGVVNGTNYSGNVSTSSFIGVKCEANRGGFDIRGTDANVVSLINCEGYLNRQYGYLDDNGAGSNTVIGMHGATNGQVTGPWPQTQCSYSGNKYAAKWGGTLTNAPSGTTADTADWLYMGPGNPVANTIPAWVNTPGIFRAGGDYLTLNSAGVHLINCYSEGGGFSQFNGLTLVEHGSLGNDMYRGGSRIIPQYNGISFRQSGDCTFYLDIGPTGTNGGLFVRGPDSSVWGYIDTLPAGIFYLAGAIYGHNFRVGTPGSYTTPLTIDGSGLQVASGAAIYNGGQKVVGARQTGTPADATDLASALTLVNALKAKLIAHGLIA